MSLFNNNPSQGSLFGNKPNVPTPGGGLFGNATSNAPTQPTGGLFNNNTTTTNNTSNLLGGGGQSQNLFGNTNNTNMQNANPLQQQQQKPAGGSLFTSTQPTQAGSLFAGGQTNTQNNNILGQQQQQQQGQSQPQQQQQQTQQQQTQQQQPQSQQQSTQPAPGGVSAGQMSLGANDVTLGNEKLNPLVQKWKRKIQNQSDNLLQTYTSLGESIQQIEQCYKYYDNIASISQGLNGQFEQINVEVNNIDQYQSQIEQHLDIIRSKLTKQLELQGDNEANAFQNPIGEKIQGIDYGLTQIEKNVSQLINEINPQKDQTQPANNTLHSSLNAYYQILEKLEFDTINLQFKLQSVAEKVADQY